MAGEVGTEQVVGDLVGLAALATGLGEDIGDETLQRAGGDHMGWELGHQMSHPWILAPLPVKSCIPISPIPCVRPNTAAALSQSLEP